VKTRNLLLLLLISVLSSGCSWEQVHRDNLRYESTNRGEENYHLNDKDAVNKKNYATDSLDAAIKRNAQEIELYVRHLDEYTLHKHDFLPFPQSGVPASQDPDGGNNATMSRPASIVPSDATQVDGQTDKSNAQIKVVTKNTKNKIAELSKIGLQMARRGDQPPSDDKASKPAGDNGDAQSASNKEKPSTLEKYWPRAILNSAQPTNITTIKDTGGNTTEVHTQQPDDGLVRALTSTMVVDQMRDLLTEPTFPALLPVERNVHLGCLPPPDSAAFEASMKLGALVQQGPDKKASLDSEFSSHVAKLFEESERTIFLQYALFRLCEMSINAPSGFRNVYPVVVHDIVRQTAEMNQLADREA